MAKVNGTKPKAPRNGCGCRVHCRGSMIVAAGAQQRLAAAPCGVAPWAGLRRPFACRRNTGWLQLPLGPARPVAHAGGPAASRVHTARAPNGDIPSSASPVAPSTPTPRRARLADEPTGGGSPAPVGPRVDPCHGLAGGDGLMPGSAGSAVSFTGHGRRRLEQDDRQMAQHGAMLVVSRSSSLMSTSAVSAAAHPWSRPPFFRPR